MSSLALYSKSKGNMYSEQILAMQVKQKLAPKALEQLASAKMVNEYLEKQKDEIPSGVCRRTVASSALSKLENLEVSGDDLFAEVEKARQRIRRVWHAVRRKPALRPARKRRSSRSSRSSG